MSKIAPRYGLVAAFVIYAGLSIAYFGRDVVASPGTMVVGDAGADKTLYMWGLVWWPHALAEGRDPLSVDVVWAPSGLELGWETAAAGLAFAAAPLTRLAGPVPTYNVLALLAPALAATTAFLLARRLTRRFAPALVGGYVFGFSTYELGHMVGHLTLAFTALVPVGAHLVCRRFNDELSRRRFVVAAAAVFAAQFLCVPQILFSLLLVGAVLAIVAWLVLDRDRRVARTVAEVARAVAACSAVVLPFLLNAVAAGTGYVPRRSAFSGSADVLNYVVPTRLTWLRPPGGDALAERFSSGPAEQGAYLGVLVLAIVLHFALTSPRTRTRLVILLGLVAVVVASFGPRIKVAGEVVGVGPWALIAPLPVVGSALPVRLTMYASLFAGLVVSLWLADVTSWRRWALTLAAVVALVPNLSLGLWSAEVPRPLFFEQGRYERFVAPGDIALVLPYGPAGWSMLWHAESEMRFRMVGGHFAIRVIPPEREWQDVYLGLGLGRVPPKRLRAFLDAHSVRVVILTPGTRPRVRRALELALEVPPTHSADALVYRVNRSSIWAGPSRRGSGRLRYWRRSRPRRSRP